MTYPKPCMINFFQHLLRRQLLGYSTTQYTSVFEGFCSASYHLRLKRGDVILTDMTVECVEQHHMLSIKTVVLYKGPDWWGWAVKPYRRTQPNSIELSKINCVRGNIWQDIRL